MILFWFCALALIALALAFLLPPLLGAPRNLASAQTDSHDMTLYRSRLAALEEECRVGALTESDLAQAKIELARELLADTGAQPAAPNPGSAPRRVLARPWLAIAVGVGVPLLSIAVYQRLGEPGALNPMRAPATPGGGAAVEDMVARLAERMGSEPGNSQGWLLLGRSYMALKRYAEAPRPSPQHSGCWVTVLSCCRTWPRRKRCWADRVFSVRPARIWRGPWRWTQRTPRLFG